MTVFQTDHQTQTCYDTSRQPFHGRPEERLLKPLAPVLRIDPVQARYLRFMPGR